MCEWKKDLTYPCEGIVLNSGDGEFVVKGKVESKTEDPTIIFWAANPPTYNTSYSGSGLPYPNSDIAYENTPNQGAVKAVNRNFEFRVRFPSSYYIGLGSLYVEPFVYIKVCENQSEGKVETIKLGNGVPFRSLTYPPISNNSAPRSNALFYKGRQNLPYRSQEQILRDSGYPENNNVPDNFWGLAVPHE